MRIAMIGQRGVPATFGGVERHVEELGAELVARGHEVVVYCRRNYAENGAPATHRGMRLVHLPTVPTKHFDAIAHSAIASMAALRGRFDVVHYHALGPGLVAPIPRFVSSARVVQTIHGRDDARAKWGLGARAVLRTAAWMSARVPDVTVVVSKELEEHYRRTYGRATVRIPNGVAEPTVRPPSCIADRFGLERGSYVLFVGRLVPEKAPDQLVRAFRAVPGDTKLAVVGGSSFTDGYAAELAGLAGGDDRVRLLGYQYGEVLDELFTNAAAFVLPSLLEGLPITLLEAGSYGTPVVASAIAPHVEVLGDADAPGTRLFPPGDEGRLTEAIERALADPEGERRGAKALREKVLGTYRWDHVAAATEAVYEGALRRRPASV